MRGAAQTGHLPVSQSPAGHLPVLYTQVLEGLKVIENGVYLDGTFGRGGHARGVLEQLGPGGRLLVMDKDPEAIAVAERDFAPDPRVSIFRGSFADLLHWDATAQGLDGVLFDLGVSSPQLDVAERGFSFGKDGPLDMRMDPDSGESAAQWLNRAEEREIADILWTYGEERWPPGRDQLPLPGRPHRQAVHEPPCQGPAEQPPVARGAAVRADPGAARRRHQGRR